ncbi:hypothetical protein EDD21DRAFT_408759 [Dissophora ornata]|nr:hypothetical protein EDD21DRAFT_408759 [Dissophora ornata]
MEVLAGAELRQLESYLNVCDKGRSLGNLYRTVTDDGHVKWVCNDHFHEGYRFSSILNLKALVAANGGSYNEVTGAIKISLKSKSLAKRFYEAIVKARGIQELDISFEWDATLSELKKFESAVSTANIINLTINGDNFKGPALDFINRHRRFGPIIELMDEALLTDIICQNPKLIFANIPCDGERSNEIIKLVTSTTERIEQEGTTTALNFLRFTDSEVYSVKRKIPLAVTSAGQVFIADSTFELDTDIEIDGDNSIDEKDIPGVFRQYGWLIKMLRTTGCKDYRCVAATSGFLMSRR